MDPKTKIGILGGGQLGKMLALAAANWDLNIWALDEDDSFPAAPHCTRFVRGDFRNYEDVLSFGRQVSILTIEIEGVNEKALLDLEREGVIVHPKPASLAIIKDKGLQKQFFYDHQLPTTAFRLFSDEMAIRQAVASGDLTLPFVQKLRTGGYDGRGVAIIRTPADLEEILLSGPSVVEDLAPIQLEIAVIAARNARGETAVFPAVEMEFNPVANLVEWLVCPAAIPPAVEARARELALRAIEAFDICGILAVEFFLTTEGEVLINEVAPRPHNSGHHTIDSCYTSQFEQHLRGILNWPLGSTEMKLPSIMVNVLGEPGYQGPVLYEGWEKIMALEGVKPHIYGKKTTKPFRKMGHITVLGKTVEEAREKARFVKDNLKAIA